MNRVFADGSWGWGSIPGRVIPKIQKMLLDTSLLNQYYKLWIKSKWSNPGKGVAPVPSPRCSSYRKRSLRVTLNNGWPTYLLSLIVFHFKTYTYHCVRKKKRRDISILCVKSMVGSILFNLSVIFVFSLFRVHINNAIMEITRIFVYYEFKGTWFKKVKINTSKDISKGRTHG